MTLTFADKKMEKLVNDDRRMLAELGKLRAAILRRRLTQLRDAANLDEVRHLPGHYHELKNDRKGQWGCDLDQPYRLVFTPHNNPDPTRHDGKYSGMGITGIEINEITNYHKEK